MIWPKRKSPHESTFVEAGPTFFERFVELWHAPGVSGPGRWMRAATLVVLSPYFVARSARERFAHAMRSAASNGLQPAAGGRVRRLLLGVPAVAAAIGAICVGAVAAGRQDDLIASYRRAASAAYAGDQNEAARIYYERLFRLDGGAAETRLFLGLTLEKLGRADEANDLIVGVAGGDAGGDARANRWVAAKLLQDLKTSKDPARLREAYRHLVRAEQGLPGDDAVQLDFAKYFLAVGEPQRAIPRLSAVATNDPSLYYELSRLHAASGDGEAAKRALERAENHFRKQLTARPDDRRTRLLLATCVANIGRPEEAVSLLREGPTHDPSGPYAKAIGAIYVAVHDRHAAQASPDHRAMLVALRAALQHDPGSVDAAVRLAGFGEGNGRSLSKPPDPGQAAEASEMLEGLLASGEQPPAVHMALGLKAWRGDDLANARWHFERAYDLDPELAGVANNLAWVLSHQSEPDLVRALAIIDSAIERFPDVTAFRDTRGEIYLRQSRWEEAISELERALPGLRHDARIHESLATAYEKLGRTKIAGRHRQEAEKLKERVSMEREKGNPPR